MAKKVCVPWLKLPHGPYEIDVVVSDLENVDDDGEKVEGDENAKGEVSSNHGMYILAERRIYLDYRIDCAAALADTIFHEAAHAVEETSMDEEINHAYIYALGFGFAQMFACYFDFKKLYKSFKQKSLDLQRELKSQSQDGHQDEPSR